MHHYAQETTNNPDSEGLQEDFGLHKHFPNENVNKANLKTETA